MHDKSLSDASRNGGHSAIYSLRSDAVVLKNTAMRTVGDMSGVLRADLGEIEAFARRLETLRSDLDLTGKDLPVTMGPVMLYNPASLYDVQAGIDEFLKAKTAAATVVDTYLAALSAMAHQSVTKIQETDAALSLDRPHTVGHRSAL